LREKRTARSNRSRVIPSSRGNGVLVLIKSVLKNQRKRTISKFMSPKNKMECKSSAMG